MRLILSSNITRISHSFVNKVEFVNFYRRVDSNLLLDSKFKSELTQKQPVGSDGVTVLVTGNVPH